MKKVLILSIVLVLLFSLCSCETEPTTDKQVPIYEGMTVSSATAPITNGIDEKTRVFANGFLADNDDKGKSFKDVEIDSDDYYADLGEDIFITIHINNPDNFEILSFTLNGEKYSSYMFEYGSNMESIIIKCNVGRESGEHEYIIDAIKYVDKQSIKDVMIRGNQTIKVVVSEFEHEANCKHDDPEKLELIPARNATCQEIGLGEGTKCNRCDTIIVPQPTFDTIECVESDWIVDKVPTETEEGLRHTECTMCGKVMNEEVTSWGSDGLAYKVNDDGETCTITGMGSCTDANLIIPAYIDGYKVTAIGDGAFTSAWEYLKSVVMSDTIVTIGGGAFMDCMYIESIILSDSLTTIGSYAFQVCEGLKTLYIPAMLTDIGMGSLGYCISLENIDVDANNQYYTSIDGSLYTKDGKTLVQYALGNGEKVVSIPDGVTCVGYTSFCGSTSITDIIIPDSVISIEAAAFHRCTALTTVKIGNLETPIDKAACEIGRDAFMDCDALEIVIIGNSVKTITAESNGVFSGCDNLSTLMIGDNLEHLTACALRGCNNLSNIAISEQNQYYKIVDGCIYSKDSKTLVMYIGNDTVTAFVVPEQVTEIGVQAFADETHLESILLPNGLLSIGDCAFLGCKALKSMVIPSGVTKIPYGAFSSCTSLESIVVPDNVTEIGGRSFNGCTALTKIIIPKDVTTIGAWAFNGCGSKLTIYCRSSSKPSGFDKYWSTSGARIVWGYTGE